MRILTPLRLRPWPVAVVALAVTLLVITCAPVATPVPSPSQASNPTPTPAATPTLAGWPTPTPTPTMTPTPTPVPTLISEAEAVSRAIEHAQFCGLKGDPTGFLAQRMTLGEYARLTHSHGPGAEKPVWVVSLRGQIDWSCPGPPGQIELYVLAVDAEDGHIDGTATFYPAERSPFGVPEVPTPTPTTLPTVPPGATEGPPAGPGAVPGETYPFTLNLHCGVHSAYFNGRWWLANPPISDLNLPADWAQDDGVGDMTLVRSDLAVFIAKSGRRIDFIPCPPEVKCGFCF
ncbi:MAG: hypothetical protein Q8P22_05475 [Chloroflexota bacterium]|nr:hypothetical protein [Chloroflexota bacterium]